MSRKPIMERLQDAANGPYDMTSICADLLDARATIEALVEALVRSAPFYCEEHCLHKAGMHSAECKANFAALAKAKGGRDEGA